MHENCIRSRNQNHLGFGLTCASFHIRQVSGIVGRAELLCTLFAWLSILLYDHAIRAKNVSHVWAAMTGCAICVSVAMLCKETGITAIVSKKCLV